METEKQYTNGEITVIWKLEIVLIQVIVSLA